MDENNKMVETQLTKCLNCGTEFHGKFCPECGQRADTKRFTVKFIFTNLLQAILSNDGGVWITIKTLFTSPGQMVVDILDGKRKSYFSPFPMLFLVLSMYIVIATSTGSYSKSSDEMFDDEEEVVVKTEDKAEYGALVARKVKYILGEMGEFSDNHYSTVFILTIPIYIFSARICFGKRNRKRYNWGEYCIPMIYSLIMVVFYQCLSSIVYLFSTGISKKMFLLSFVVNIAAFTACFKKMMEFNTGKMIRRSILMWFFYWVSLIFLIIVGVGIITVFVALYYGL